MKRLVVLIFSLCLVVATAGCYRIANWDEPTSDGGSSVRPDLEIDTLTGAGTNSDLDIDTGYDTAREDDPRTGADEDGDADTAREDDPNSGADTNGDADSQERRVIHGCDFPEFLDNGCLQYDVGVTLEEAEEDCARIQIGPIMTHGSIRENSKCEILRPVSGWCEERGQDPPRRIYWSYEKGTCDKDCDPERLSSSARACRDFVSGVYHCCCDCKDWPDCCFNPRY